MAFDAEGEIMMQRVWCAGLLALMVGSVQAQQMAQSKIQVNLREGFGPPSRIVAVLSKGELVTIMDTEGEYAMVVTADGEEGYVRSVHLNPKEAAAAPAASSPQATARAKPKPKAMAAAQPKPKAVATRTAKKSGMDWPVPDKGGRVMPPPKRIFTAPASYEAKEHGDKHHDGDH